MASSPVPNKKIGQDSSGIALFMVIAAVSVLAILVSEFTYISQISQMIAYGALDQAKAHYMAKSALKLSLLRLKAYQFAKNKFSGPSAAAMGIPNSLIEQIWKFPFSYPIPTNIPGMTISDKSLIENFEKESGFDGKMSAIIESESAKYNLNLLVANYATAPSPSPTPSSAAPPPPPSSDGAQKSLTDYLGDMMTQKFQADPDFAANYRDFRLNDFVDSLTSWADQKYTRRTPPNQDKVPMKKAPFYSINELHMLPIIDDDLYNLFAPGLTVHSSSTININGIQTESLHALIPLMSKEEISDFYKYRDSDEVDNHFNAADDFYKYLTNNVAVFKNNQPAIEGLKKEFQNAGITLDTSESQFKITARAEVNSSIRTIEAWVTLVPLDPKSAVPISSDPGLKIIFMKMM